MSELVVAVAARARSLSRTGDRGVAAAHLRWPDGTARTLVRHIRRDDPAPAAWRALLLGLWAARQAGARVVTLVLNDADLAAVLDGRADPPADAVVASLQSRALLNAFRSAAIRVGRGDDPDLQAAEFAAASGKAGCPGLAGLPLWSAAAS